MIIPKYKRPVLFYSISIIIPWVFWFTAGYISHLTPYTDQNLRLASVISFIGLLTPLSVAYWLISEFFADFGVYDVKIIIPDEFIVGVTGILLDKAQIDGNRKRLHYYAEDVHDFARGAVHPIIQQYLETSDYLDYKIASVDQNRVKIVRTGTQIFQVNIEFTFEGNKQVTKQWMNTKSFITYDFSKKSHLIGVCIDPDQMIEFELNAKNNCWNFDI